MAESIKSEDNCDSCLNLLLDILREKRKLRLGNPQSGEYIIIEYKREDTNLDSVPRGSSTQSHTSSNSVPDSPLPDNLIDNDEDPSNSIQQEEGVSFPRVFISYSHDSHEHKERVRKLSDVLIKVGIDCSIDLYGEQTRAKRWPQWMREQVEQAQFVLVVCTKKYKERFDGNTGGVGWEGAIIDQGLYENQNSDKFIPVFFYQEDGRHIPTSLHGWNRYVLDIEKLEELYIDMQEDNLEAIDEKLKNNLEYEQYKKLYCQLTLQSLHEKPELGKLLKFAPKNKDKRRLI